MYWIAFGDIHESIGMARSIPGLDQAEGVIVTGDLTNRGGRAAGARVLDVLAAINPRILAQPGNMDTEAVQALLRERGADIHRTVRELAPGLGLAGVGLSTPTPFGTPGEVSEATLAAWLDAAGTKLARFDRKVVAVHEPPQGTSLDRVMSGQHVGSPAVRRFIERFRPDVVLTGHIHESRGAERIGETLVINPGALADGGYVRLTYADGELAAELLEA